MKIHLCTISGCTSPVVARGWCDAHYRRWRRHGTPTGGRHPRTGCTIPDCGRPHDARGYCTVHYARWARHGNPETVYDPRDLDEVAVDRAVHGDQADRLTVAEREVAVRRLHRLGLHDREIGLRIGLGASGVWTIRQRLGLAANRPGEPIGDHTGRAAA